MSEFKWPECLWTISDYGDEVYKVYFDITDYDDAHYLDDNRNGHWFSPDDLGRICFLTREATYDFLIKRYKNKIKLLNKKKNAKS